MTQSENDPKTISSDMLQAFLKVAEWQSVSAAAEDLGTSKSQVSKRVAQLEAQMRAALFSRTTRKVALTPAGETYVEFARRAMAEIQAGEERLRAMRSELSGSIRVTAPVSWGQRVLAKRLPEFLRLHPAIEIQLELSDHFVDLARQRIDLALRWSATTQQEMHSIPLAPIGWLLAASPSYLTQAGMPKGPDDLTGHACFSYWREQSDDTWTLSMEDRRKRTVRKEVKVRSRYHVNNPEAVGDAAIQGLGIALLPDYLCDQALKEGLLVQVLPGWKPQTKFGSHITAVVAPERMLLSRNRVLLDFLRGGSPEA
ncbi:LysR family transcriptional regulator [Polaromonas sp.]|uniref:LysR family transcriptional regulator n=1 Tax=Polaromonas sp. TaxID=1869339 RepID=UPI0037536A77